MKRILGIDPGSRITGYGIIESDGRDSQYIDCGAIHVNAETLPEKLGLIYREVAEIIQTWQPLEMAIEEVFVSRNASSALKLGQARGAAICAAIVAGLPVAEYSARQVKQSVVGTGAADKAQVQHMVKMLLKLKQSPQSDAADALAIALSHAHTQAVAAKIPSVLSGLQR